MPQGVSQSQESWTVPRERIPYLNPAGNEDDSIWQVGKHAPYMAKQADFDQRLSDTMVATLCLWDRRAKARVFSELQWKRKTELCVSPSQQGPVEMAIPAIC